MIKVHIFRKMADIIDRNNSEEKKHDEDGYQNNNPTPDESSPLSRTIYLSSANTNITAQSFGNSFPGFAKILPVQNLAENTVHGSVEGKFLKYFIILNHYIFYEQIKKQFPDQFNYEGGPITPHLTQTTDVHEQITDKSNMEKQVEDNQNNVKDTNKNLYGLSDSKFHIETQFFVKFLNTLFKISVSDENNSSSSSQKSCGYKGVLKQELDDKNATILKYSCKLKQLSDEKLKNQNMYMEELFILEKNLAESKKTTNIYEQEMKQLIEEKNKITEDMAYMYEDLQIKHKEEIRDMQAKHQEQISLLEKSLAESQLKINNLIGELTAMKNAYQQSVTLMSRIQGNIDVFNRLTPTYPNITHLEKVILCVQKTCTVN